MSDATSPLSDLPEKPKGKDSTKNGEPNYEAELVVETRNLVNETRALATWTKRLGIFTIAIVILGFVQALLSGLAIHSAEDIAHETRDSVHVRDSIQQHETDSALGISELAILKQDTATEQQLRAYVDISNFPKCSVFSDGIKFTVKNTGRTPAYNVECWYARRIAVTRRGEVPSLPLSTSTEYGANIELGANLSFDANDEKWKPLTAADFSQVKAMGGQIFYFVRIDYSDIFKTRHSSIAFYLADSTGTFHPAPNGSSAN